IALAKLGSRVGIVSRVGDDDLGRWMRTEVERAGIDPAGVAVVAGQLTPLALVSVDAAGRKRFAYYRFAGRCDPLATLRASDVPDALFRRARVFDIGEASLRDPGLRVEALALMRRARDLGLTVCYAPNYRESAWAGGAAEAAATQRAAIGLADITLMNLEEARLIAGMLDGDAADIAGSIVGMGPAIVVVTDGAAGAAIATPQQVAYIPPVPVRVVFDIGAGDAFHAGFLAAWRPGADSVWCARFATQTAALKISRPPDPNSAPTRAEVLAAMGE
ncbi:MAG TPA: PfkB family carbohydrate kinase, partial [Thermomicrobiales bacterium]|nr:PfkB family carbohydrate kinase [Thermomicrobiales bacterium]